MFNASSPVLMSAVVGTLAATELRLIFMVDAILYTSPIKDIQRKNIPEYPLEGLREALINALMHRDYTQKGANVQIDIFDDRIQISNVGELIPPLTKENIGQIAVRRNPLIADLF